jgi:hypothetical protein
VILLGLVQAEPLARYLAMLAIQKALPSVKRTLFEMEVFSVGHSFNYIGNNPDFG